MGITCCKGMRDILPAEMDSWYYLENIAFRLVEAYGYREIRTPLFENKELFTSCIGRDSGTLQNKLWTIKGHNGESWALRPDMTASTLRAYCEHRLYLDSAGPTKLFYLGPVFQHSSGRKSFNWQGYQFGLEALGTEDPSSDVEVIMMAHDLCQELGLPKVRVHINTLGCAHCRPVYQQLLSEFFARHSAELCSSCISRYKNRPLWVLGCPEERCRSLSSIVPSIHSCLCEDCEAHFRTVCAYLSELKVDYVIDPLVVRDVDCYNRTIFQVVCAGRLVAFGGRYDGMAGRVADPACEEADANAVGCSMDIEPLLNLMDEMNINVGKYAPCPKVCFVGDSREAVQLMLPVLYALRRSKVVSELKSEEIGSEESLSKASAARFIVGLQDMDVRSRMVTFYDGELDRFERMSLDEALTIIGRELRIKNLPAELRPSDMRNWSIATRSHHTLDGNNRLRRPSEPKTRSRSRRLSLKTEQLLPASMREVRSRKNTGYAVTVTRDTMAAGHVRKRRRPENEDSLETTAVEMPNSMAGSYPEPVLSPARRERRAVDVPKSACSSRVNGGRSRSESASAREHKSERLLYGHSDKLNFSDVESLVYSRGSSRRQGRLLLDKELEPLEFGDMGADPERIAYYPEDDALPEAAVNADKHGKRRMRTGKDSQRQSYVNSDVASLYVDDPFDKAAGDEADRRPNIIQNINRWASERYGISEAQEVEALPVPKPSAPRKESSRSRGGRQSLARNRELKALAAAVSSPETAAETVLSGSVPEQPAAAEKETVCEAEAESAAAAVNQSEAGNKAEDTQELPAVKAASSKKRGAGSKRRVSEKTADEKPAEMPPAEILLQNDIQPDAASPAGEAVPDITDSSGKTDGEADLSPAAEAAVSTARPKGKRGTSTRRTLTSARRTAASPRRSGKKAAAAEQTPEPEAAETSAESSGEPSPNTAQNAE